MEHKEFWYGLYGDKMAERIAQLEAENEKLREALRKHGICPGCVVGKPVIDERDV